MRNSGDNLYARDRVAESLRELDSDNPRLQRIRHMLAAALRTLGGPPEPKRNLEDDVRKFLGLEPYDKLNDMVNRYGEGAVKAEIERQKKL